MEGVIDTAVRTDAGWLVLDWKTDDVPADVWAMRRVFYETQAARYAEMLERITATPASAELVRLAGPRGGEA
jgi:ATP-dependent exoDNAse (exonuclease V) beta subunit